jgi:hypothetical protein
MTARRSPSTVRSLDRSSLDRSPIAFNRSIARSLDRSIARRSTARPRLGAYP